MTRAISLSAIVIMSAVALLPAQGRRGSAAAGADERCFNPSRSTYCETRDDALGALAAVTVDASPNGGIAVRGSDRSDVHLRTRLVAWADSDDAARALAADVRVVFSGGSVHAEGPRGDDRRGWSASFELEVPRRTDLQLTARNGGISIAGVDGDTRFDTRNGGVSLTDIGGDVRGTTVNGGVSVQLSASRWNGTGLDVATRNGGVSLTLPDAIDAQLDVETVNGGVRSDFAAAGSGRRNGHVLATLGAGGPRLHLSTVNGGVRIARR